jgi:hypothetical protein
MAGEVEQFASCADCGATIYPEHLEKRVAEHWEGKLLCPFCLREKRMGSAVGMTPPGAPEGAAQAATLVELESAGGSGAGASIGYEKKPTAIRAMSSSGSGAPVGHVSERKYHRELLKGSAAATRCKTFHCKLAEGPIAYMCDQINEWADSDENIEIKFATSTIGVVEGKHVDPHLIVTVFY